MKIVRDEGEGKGKGKKEKVVSIVNDDSTAIVKFDIETAVITALDTKYKDIKVTDGKSYAFVMKGIGEYRELRLKIDDRHKVLKKDALEYGRRVDAEKNRLKGLLEPGENHLKEVRQVEDDRKTEIKAVKEAKEQARVDKIRSKINDLQAVLITIITLPSNKIQAIQMEVESIEISVIDYMEFTEEAERVKANVLNTIQDYMKVTIENEKEDAERKIEAERFEKIRVEQEVTQKKIDEANQKLKEKEAILEKKEWERTEKIRIAKEMEEEKVKVEKEQEVEAERLEKDIAEQNRLKPDKERLIEYADKLFNITHPNVKAKSSKELLIEMNNRLFKLITGFKNQINKL